MLFRSLVVSPRSQKPNPNPDPGLSSSFLLASLPCPVGEHGPACYLSRAEKSQPVLIVPGLSMFGP
jgi:hypothetical protein